MHSICCIFSLTYSRIQSKHENIQEENNPAGWEELFYRYCCYITSSAVKRLIVINLIQNKSFSSHNMCVYCVYLLCIYKYTLMQYIFWRYLHIFTCIYLIYKHNSLEYIHACMCIYIYIINIHSTHTHILCEEKLLFWMRLITINRLTALITLIYQT